MTQCSSGLPPPMVRRLTRSLRAHSVEDRDGFYLDQKARIRESSHAHPGRRWARLTRKALPDASHGKRPRLLAIALTIESQTALAEVVEPRAGGIALRGRPVEAVGFQSSVLAIVVSAAAAQLHIETRAASDQERRVGRMTSVIRVVVHPTVAFRQLAPV